MIAPPVEMRSSGSRLSASFERLRNSQSRTTTRRCGKRIAHGGDLRCQSTPEEDERLKSLLASDASVITIAVKLKRTVNGVKAVEAVEHLAERGVCAFADPGTHGVFAVLGVGEVGGAVRVGHTETDDQLSGPRERRSEQAVPLEELGA